MYEDYVRRAEDYIRETRSNSVYGRERAKTRIETEALIGLFQRTYDRISAAEKKGRSSVESYEPMRSGLGGVACLMTVRNG